MHRFVSRRRVGSERHTRPAPQHRATCRWPDSWGIAASRPFGQEFQERPAMEGKKIIDVDSALFSTNRFCILLRHAQGMGDPCKIFLDLSCRDVNSSSDAINQAMSSNIQRQDPSRTYSTGSKTMVGRSASTSGIRRPDKMRDRFNRRDHYQSNDQAAGPVVQK